MDVSAPWRDPGHDVGIVNNSVIFYIYLFPKIVIADSGRTKGVNALDITISASKKCCKGGSQAVPGRPDFTPLAMQLSDMGQKIRPDFIQCLLESPVHFTALVPIRWPNVDIVFKSATTSFRSKLSLFFPDFAASESDNGEFIVIGDIALRALIFEKFYFRQPGLFKSRSDKIFIGIHQGRSLCQPPGIDDVK